MQKIAQKICDNKVLILIVTSILFVLSLIGMKLTKINYDILVYLPEEIETVQGQNILTEDFGMGAYSVVIAENLKAQELLDLESKYEIIDGVNKAISAYDLFGSTIPIDIFPSEITEKIHKDNTDLIFVTFDESTSSLKTIDAIEQMKEISKNSAKISGMSAMVLDTMNLSDKEIMIYIVIAVILCLIVLELSLDSYLVPLLLLGNIGIAIVFNLGSNIIFGSISYITKALVAVLQLGVTTDFSIFLYHAYESKKNKGLTKEKAMQEAISETFTSVTGSSLTTIAGFLVLITMNLTLGKDLGLVMAKGVLLGVICVLTVFPSLLLVFDNLITKTHHKPLTIHFEKFNNFVVKHNKAILVLFLILLIPAYLANSKVSVYYKIDESLPKSLDSIVANNELKEQFKIVSPEIILIDKNIKSEKLDEMVSKIESVDGVDFVLSFSKLKSRGITENMLSSDIVKIFESDKYQMLFLNSYYDIASNELNNQVSEINNIIKSYDKGAILAGEGPLMKDLVKTSDEDFNNVNTSSIICILIIMFFVLKSFSLPILLILAIEFAIFINMSIAYFGNVTLPFVAPIVLGTIQLGATIDYAILLTTTYLKNRRAGMAKKDAILATTNYCANSIFVSGMCFFAATFGVGVYSKLEMVGSLCTLISRGAIISMLVVLTVLPSILITFDSLIMKTTKKEKGMNNMQKNKKLVTALFVGMFLLPLNTFALTKEETVYTRLNTDGSVKSTFVTEHLKNTEKLDNIEDQTSLTDIFNMTSDRPFVKNGDLVTFESAKKDVFYQGITNKELPITESITYTLDGKDISLTDLIGQSGHVTIKIKYTNSDLHKVNVNGTVNNLYTPFVVTTTTIIPGEDNENVTITNGKIVDTGSNYMLVGISAPGLYESLALDELKEMDTITISYDTKRFSLSSIISLATPKILDTDELSIFDSLDDLYKNVDKLQTSMNVIESGSAKIKSGTASLSEGASLISQNLNTVASKITAIKNGSIKIDDGVEEILKNLESASITLTSSSNKESITSLKTLMAKNTETINILKEGNTKLETAYNTYRLKDVTYDSLIESKNKTFYNLKFQYENMYASNALMITLLEKNNEALTETLKTMDSTSKTLSITLNTLTTYLKEVKSGTKELSSGLTLLESGVNTLSSKTKELASGAKTLETGMNSLDEGIKEFNKSGINAISSMANNAKSYTNKVEALKDLSDNYQVFAGKKGDTKSTTKFILNVDGVKASSESNIVTSTSTKKSFWELLKGLFTK